ncbi:MAG: hypothetical protein ABL925_20410 [Methylococcales bacterium]
MDYKQFQPGQKVRNKFGQVLTVLYQEGCQVFVEEECMSHYHPNNLFPILETIPAP